MLFTFSLVVYSDVIRFSPPLLYFLYVSFFSSPINTTGRVLPISTCCCLSASLLAEVSHDEAIFASS